MSLEQIRHQEVFRSPFFVANCLLVTANSMGTIAANECRILPLKTTASLENATPPGALSQYFVAINPMSRLVQTVMEESIEPSAVVERAMPHAVNTKLTCNGGVSFLSSWRKLSCTLCCEQNARKNVVFLFGRAFSLEILHSKTRECGFWTWASKSTVSTVSQCFKQLKRHVTVTNDMSRGLSIDGLLPQIWLSGQ